MYPTISKILTQKKRKAFLESSISRNIPRPYLPPLFQKFKEGVPLDFTSSPKIKILWRNEYGSGKNLKREGVYLELAMVKVIMDTHRMHVEFKLKIFMNTNYNSLVTLRRTAVDWERI